MHARVRQRGQLREDSGVLTLVVLFGIPLKTGARELVLSSVSEGGLRTENEPNISLVVHHGVVEGKGPLR